MSTRLLILLALTVTALGVGGFFAVRAWNEQQASQDDIDIDSIKVVSSETLPGTRVTPVTTLPLDPKLNAIYCGVFQLAWTELAQMLANEPLLLEGNPPAVAELNAMRFTRDDASTCQVQVSAGPATDELLEECAEKLRDISAARPDLLTETRTPNTFIAYGILEKSLSFAKQFDKLDPAIFRGADGDTKVKYFGYDAAQHDRHSAVGELFGQVFVADYVSSTDFILCLDTNSEDDDLVLARVPPQETLQATVEAVNQRVAESRKVRDWWKQGYRGEPLQIPLINVGLIHQFKDLERTIANLSLPESYIGTALQAMRFKLDRTGAILKSEVRIEKEAKSEFREEPRKPREFIFNGPFLIYLTKRNSPRPYFVAWIANAELFQRAD